jgi:hypothetical protein
VGEFLETFQSFGLRKQRADAGVDNRQIGAAYIEPLPVMPSLTVGRTSRLVPSSTTWAISIAGRSGAPSIKPARPTVQELILFCCRS